MSTQSEVLPSGTTPAFRRVAFGTALTSLVVIAIGGATRATDSGLACPTWPGCFTGGDFLPPLSVDAVDGLGRTVTGLNVWMEHSHRLVAGLLAIEIAILLVWAIARYRHIGGVLWPIVVAAVAVNVQAGLGALVVANLVQAELVTLHLGLGTGTMALMVFVAARSRGPLVQPSEDSARRLWRFGVITTTALWAQILIGGHLTGVVGGLAFKSDAMLGLFSIGPITVEAEAVNVAHRYLAFVVAGLIISLGIRVKRAGVGGAALTWVRVAAGLTGLQILLGIANLYTDTSFVSVIPHLAVASWILAAMVMTVIGLSSTPATMVDAATAPTRREVMA